MRTEYRVEIVVFEVKIDDDNNDVDADPIYEEVIFETEEGNAALEHARVVAFRET